MGLTRAQQICYGAAGFVTGVASTAALTSTNVIVGGVHGAVVTGIYLTTKKHLNFANENLNRGLSATAGLVGSIPVTFVIGNVLIAKVTVGQVVGLSISFGLTAAILAIAYLALKRFCPEAVASRYHAMVARLQALLPTLLPIASKKPDATGGAGGSGGASGSGDNGTTDTSSAASGGSGSGSGVMPPPVTTAIPVAQPVTGPTGPTASAASAPAGGS